ncbi:ABC transporter permease [Lachnoclostridium sp.]|uniref:ABC transporter permease n=1 Tax=Lachnoclostridium sp. TaxID=2028282 RepID=UPI00289B7685|nr:ABC transporter permease [Lachnoclostridium sp.]
MKLLLIAKNNIKSSLATSVILVLLVILSTFMMYTGIGIESQLNEFVDEKNERLHGADSTVIVGNSNLDNVIMILNQREDISKYEVHDSIYYTSPKICNKTRQDKGKNLITIVLNASDSYNISQIPIIDETTEKLENGILVPYILKTADKYETGDELEITVENRTHTFVIAGFYENVIFATPSNISMYQFFVYDSEFQTLREEVVDSAKQSVINIHLDGTGSEEFKKSFALQFKGMVKGENTYLQILSYDTFKEGTTMFVNILMVILIAFSLILLTIALVVIRFSIIVHLEKNIKNIGSLEAIGYTTRQIKYSLLLEFIMLTLGGILVGLVLAMTASSSVGNIISASIGLQWIGHISSLGIISSFMINLLLILIVTAMTARKLKRITPLVALRSGIETHNFKRNYLPLTKSKLNLNFAIGVKGLLFNRKQNIVMSVIISLLTFACVYALAMYYNFVIDDSALLNLVGMETSEIQMSVNANDYDKVINQVKEMEEVTKVYDFIWEDMLLKNGEKESQIRVEVTDDFSLLEVKTLIKGRLAEYDNEIVISNKTLDDLGLKLGDSVAVSSFGREEQYLIVGVKQHINGLGKGASLTTEGMKRLKPNYKITMASIYLANGVDVKNFINKLNYEFSDVDKLIINLEDSINTVMESFRGSVSTLCIVCGGITAITVVLILLLLIKVKIIKEQKQYGIYKALGYTTSQLILHVGYSYLPVILLGSMIGIVLGFLLSDPITRMLLASNGIMKVNFIMPYQYIVFIPLGIILVSAITILLSSLRIRSITPTKLLDQ